MSVLLSLLLLLQDEPAALIERLSSDRSADRQEAEKALLKLGEPALPLLEKAAKDKDPEIAARASRLVRMLANRKRLTPRLRAVFPRLDEQIDPEDYPAWTTLFLEVSGMTNSGATYATLRKDDLLPLVAPAIRGADSVEMKGRICSGISNRALGAAAPQTGIFLKGPWSRELWDSVRHCLRHATPEEAVAAMEPVLTNASAEIRLQGILELRDLKARATLAPAYRALRDPDKWVRHWAFEVIEWLLLPEAAPELLPYLKHPEFGTRANAAWTLARVAGKDAVPSLLPMLNDEHDFVRVKTMMGLRGLVGPEALPQLLPHLSSPHPGLVRATMSTLTKLQGKEAVPMLISFLEHPDKDLRYEALQDLEDLKAVEAAPRVVLRLKDDDELIRAHAVAALSAFGAREYAKDVLPLLKDPVEDVQYVVLDAVGPLQIRAAIPQLLLLLKHENESLRGRAFSALDALAAPEAVPAALAMLKSPDRDDRETARKFLRHVRDPRVVPALFAMLESDGDDFEMALDLLPVIGGKEVTVRCLELLEHLQGATREAAVQILTTLHVPELEARFVSMLRHRDPDLRIFAASHLSADARDEAIPDLVKLLSDPEPRVRLLVLKSLEGEDDPRIIAAIEARLEDPDAAIRAAALANIRGSATPAAPKILRLLQDADLRIQEAAFETACDLGLKEALPAALKALKADDPGLRAAAFRVLQTFGDPAELAPQILPYLDSPETDVRTQALIFLGERAGDRLLQASRDADIGVRFTAMSLLCSLHRPEGLSLFLEELKVEERRLEAIGWLGSLGNPDAIPPLLKLLDSGDPNLEGPCLSALVSLGAREVIPRLLESLAQDEISVTQTAAWQAGRLHAIEAIPHLARLASADRERSDSAFIAALADYPPEQSGPLLQKLLSDSDPAVRRSGIVSLRLLKRPSAAPAIRPLLGDADAQVRASAVLALMEMDDRAALPDLLPRLADPDPKVSGAAIDAVHAFRAREAIPALRALLEDPSIELRRSALRALGALESREDAARIRAFLKDDNDRLREAAIEALGALDAREAAPEILALLKRDGSFEAASVLTDWGVREALPDIARLLTHDRAYPERVAALLCKLGSSEGVPIILRSGYPLFVLHALRSPELWERLGKLRAPGLNKGCSLAHFAQLLAAPAGLQVPAADLEATDWSTGWVPEGSVRDVLEGLSRSSVNFVIDGGQLRLLDDRQARRFWRAWWREQQKKK